MTTLCEANRAAGSTKQIFSISLIIPVLMGLTMCGLALGAAPGQPFHENYLAIIGLVMVGIAISLFPLPYIFRWNWESKFYGSFIFPLSTGSVLGVCPTLCIAMYGRLNLILSILIIVLEIIIIIWWCWKIVKVYQKINHSKLLFASIYIEKSDAVYYLLQGDKIILEKNMKFYVCPSAMYFVVPMLIAFLTAPFNFSVSDLLGVPFAHVFMALVGAPLNLLFFGICTKCWLVFYYYPKKISQATGKKVYVDMSSLPEKYGRYN